MDRRRSPAWVVAQRTARVLMAWGKRPAEVRAEREAGESIKEGGGRRGELPKIQNRGQKSDSQKTPKSQGGVRDLLSGAGGEHRRLARSLA